VGESPRTDIVQTAARRFIERTPDHSALLVRPELKGEEVRR
jgi:hypothetical protein